MGLNRIMMKEIEDDSLTLTMGVNEEKGIYGYYKSPNLTIGSVDGILSCKGLNGTITRFSISKTPTALIPRDNNIIFVFQFTSDKTDFTTNKTIFTITKIETGESATMTMYRTVKCISGTKSYRHDGWNEIPDAFYNFFKDSNNKDKKFKIKIVFQ